MGNLIDFKWLISLIDTKPLAYSALVTIICLGWLKNENGKLQSRLDKLQNSSSVMREYYEKKIDSLSSTHARREEAFNNIIEGNLNQMIVTFKEAYGK